MEVRTLPRRGCARTRARPGDGGARPAPGGAGRDECRDRRRTAAGQARPHGRRPAGKVPPAGQEAPSRPRDRKRRPAHSVRLNETELAIIQAGADHVGMSVAGFLAHSALAAARDQSRTAASIATERDVLTALFGARRQLGWAGSNINQIARALNSGADAPHFAAALDDLQRAARAVQAASDRVTEHRDREGDSI
ncbi:plasmid mobilization relaxosome protein MobC [Streptomyces sp. NPDC056716]|uniref:plasmid mobilization protein n=1 Tax=unclassified Streptomyces TaxID=2593676 RepID=UPI00369607C3